MPRGDGTGPFGRGPMTGWGDGYCIGNDRPGTESSGRGFGRGRGFFSWRRGPGLGGKSLFPPGGFQRQRCIRRFSIQNRMSDPDIDKNMLQRRAEVLRAELDAVEKRLDETGSRS